MNRRFSLNLGQSEADKPARSWLTGEPPEQRAAVILRQCRGRPTRLGWRRQFVRLLHTLPQPQSKSSRTPKPNTSTVLCLLGA